MGLRIVSSSSPDLSDEMRQKIEAAVPDAAVEVRSTSPGHYEIRVTSPAFEGKTRVQQQQLVYGAIMDFMSGDEAPVHAIDQLLTRTP